jgi:demethylmenaquinone methyltransferase / 2-methoxy-6-polyprenyl-1,4-benzoquinol methylase
MSFGIRNVEDVPAALRELHRVTKPGGQLLLLEFSLPSSKLIRYGHKLYLHSMVPLLGRLIARNTTAYRYLADTIESFPYGKAFCDLVLQAGYSSCIAHRLSLGVTTLYVATV